MFSPSLAHAYDVIGSGTTPPTNEDKWFGDGVPWVTTGELRETVVEQTTKNVTFEALNQFSALKIHPAGSVVIAMYGATIGRLGVLGIDATTNQACCVLTQSQHLYNQYVFYWLYAFRDEIIKLSSGGGQPNINQEKVASLKITAPDYSHQKKIVSFLDYETARIDQLIAKQQQLIELLKEKRQAVISHAVTKGLTPNAPMKDSGVEWLGQVPEHWVVAGFKKFLGKIIDYRGKTPEKTDSGVFLVTARNIKNGVIDYSLSQEFVSESDYEEIMRRGKPSIGDVLFTTEAPLGEVAQVDRTDIALAQRIIKFCGIANILSNDYLKMYMQSTSFQQGLQTYATGSTALGIKADRLGYLRQLLPPIVEQSEIVEYVKCEQARYSKLISVAEKAISIMQERRTALISAAVTGKIDLRGWQPPKCEVAA
ncbi:restriction endonuclease subunit S [Aeromonas veronii]|uniref:restriction endonuclease subunit S n=1 Tax=Aeromonas veronii TaxID=654 RepID=UPI00211D21DB|nr:restriction endonuclease subunit S [Aeromonas veronii]UUM69379.1 restriction endonuclease subunit S [Aeromonas veronii]